MAAPQDRRESRAETPLEAELPICDAHHHLWERVPNVYLLGDLRADLPVATTLCRQSLSNVVTVIATMARMK